MKFDYCREQSIENSFCPQYSFKFTLTEDELRRVTHKYGLPSNWAYDVFNYSSADSPYQMLTSLSVIQDAIGDDRVDLGINYKEKYEELVELLKPYKIDDDMPPSTTLKMILKYHK